MLTALAKEESESSEVSRTKVPRERPLAEKGTDVGGWVGGGPSCAPGSPLGSCSVFGPRCEPEAQFVCPEVQRLIPPVQKYPERNGSGRWERRGRLSGGEVRHTGRDDHHHPRFNNGRLMHRFMCCAESKSMDVSNRWFGRHFPISLQGGSPEDDLTHEDVEHFGRIQTWRSPAMAEKSKGMGRRLAT
jgi:hypothetical protein